jgi:hypothetical protein
MALDFTHIATLPREQQILEFLRGGRALADGLQITERQQLRGDVPVLHQQATHHALVFELPLGHGRKRR